MRKRKFVPKRNSEFLDEERQWLNITPARRILETTKLWAFYLALGGSLDPEPDPQSPFYFHAIGKYKNTFLTTETS